MVTSKIKLNGQRLNGLRQVPFTVNSPDFNNAKRTRVEHGICEYDHFVTKLKYHLLHLISSCTTHILGINMLYNYRIIFALL